MIQEQILYQNQHISKLENQVDRIENGRQGVRLAAVRSFGITIN